MTHKEFYYWLDGFLHDKKNLSYDELAVFLLTIKEKMGKVKEDSKFNIERPINIPIPVNPIKVEDDSLGKPPKIVM